MTIFSIGKLPLAGTNIIADVGKIPALTCRASVARSARRVGSASWQAKALRGPKEAREPVDGMRPGIASIEVTLWPRRLCAAPGGARPSTGGGRGSRAHGETPRVRSLGGGRKTQGVYAAGSSDFELCKMKNL